MSVIKILELYFSKDGSKKLDKSKGIIGTDSGSIYLKKDVFFKREDVKKTLKELRESQAINKHFVTK